MFYYTQMYRLTQKKLRFFLVLVFSLFALGQVFIPMGSYQPSIGTLSISDTPSYDFGNNYQNIPVDKTFTLSNLTTSPIVGIVANAFSSSVFSFKGGAFPGTGGTCSSSLQRGASCTIVVTALHNAAGTINSAVSLDYKTISGTTNLSLPVTVQFNLWSPASLGVSLAGWYDASDAATVRTGAGGVSQAANGNAVSQWQDKSGNARHANQATGTRQPILNTTGWTGSLPTLDWDSNDDGFTITGLTWQTYTVAMLMRHSTIGNVRVLLTKRTGVGNGILWFLFTSNVINWDQNGARISTGFTPSAATDYIYVLVRPLAGTNRTQYVNGTLNGTSATNADESNTQDIILGNDFGTTNRGIDSNISEVVLTTSNVSAADRERLEGYLAWKWGNVSALPGGHPYKLAPP